MVVLKESDLIDCSTEIYNQAEIVNKMVKEIVQKYCGDLDNYIHCIQERFRGDSSNISDEELDSIIFNIPLKLYYINSGAEEVGLREDICKAIKAEKYRDVIVSVTGTAEVKRAHAESNVYKEHMINIIYSRAYKEIKSRVDMAFEVMQSAKKIINRRIGELELSQRNSGGTINVNTSRRYERN